MQKPLANQKFNLPTDLPSDRHGKVQSRVFATNNIELGNAELPLARTHILFKWAYLKIDKMMMIDNGLLR